jgi:hypothetical protein
MTAHTTPLALVGNTLSVLVGATERARRGLPTLVVNPGGPWGAYFGGVQADNRRWDAGMVMYEFTSFRQPETPPALSSYDPLIRNDIGRFCGVVHDYVARHQPTRDIEPPQMWIDGQVLPDLLLANGLDALRQLPCAQAARAELRESIASALASPWHAGRKNDWPAKGQRSAGDERLLDADTVSRLNHGRVLHEAVFDRFAHQVMDRDASHLAALYHRIPWLPLYWPDTLLAWLEGRPQPLPPTVFSHPRGASVADLCATLAARLVKEPLVTLRQEKLSRIGRSDAGFMLELAQGETVHATRLAWGQTPHQGLLACGNTAAAPPEERLPLLLGFLRLPRAAMLHDFSVLHVIGEASGVYRVNHVSHCADELDGTDVRLVVEAHPERFARRHGDCASDEDATRALIADLAGLGLLKAGTVPHFAKLIRMAGALPLPTPDGLAAYAADRHRLVEHLPGLETIGPSAGPFATSLSDQIVQGLVLAEPATFH